MRHYRWRAVMSAADVRRTARAVGFTKEQADVVVRIAFCESRHQPRAHTDNPSTGDNSYGLMMINMIGDLGPARRKQYGLTTNEQLAWRISKGRAGLVPLVVRPPHRRHLIYLINHHHMIYRINQTNRRPTRTMSVWGSSKACGQYPNVNSGAESITSSTASHLRNAPNSN